jgi:hypothetical protein
MFRSKKPAHDPSEELRGVRSKQMELEKQIQCCRKDGEAAMDQICAISDQLIALELRLKKEEEVRIEIFRKIGEQQKLAEEISELKAHASTTAIALGLKRRTEK